MTRAAILKRAKNKMIAGAKKHGKWKPGDDDRDLFDEAIEELIDVINYFVMQVQKLDLLRHKLKKHETIS